MQELSSCAFFCFVYPRTSPSSQFARKHLKILNLPQTGFPLYPREIICFELGLSIEEDLIGLDKGTAERENVSQLMCFVSALHI